MFCSLVLSPCCLTLGWISFLPDLKGVLPSSINCLLYMPWSRIPLALWDISPSVLPSLLYNGSATNEISCLSGLYPFTLSHYGLHSPCLRFTANVAISFARLGIVALSAFTALLLFTNRTLGLFLSHHLLVVDSFLGAHSGVFKIFVMISKYHKL